MSIDTNKDSMFSVQNLTGFGIKHADDGSYLMRTVLDDTKAKLLGTTINHNGMITYDNEGVDSLFRLATIGLLSVNSAKI